MAEVKWMPGALKDIDAIAAYIALDSSFRAGQQVLRILSAETFIERYPGAGRMVPEIRDQEIRQLILPPYRIIYHLNISMDLASILAVIHSKQKLTPTMLRRRT